ncbi:hypothetical protein G7Y79_00001g004030 [Physcia stellaris]|nr:hypothetical protein G7Y79_00001g004030 [Physcia stellaris]
MGWLWSSSEPPKTPIVPAPENNPSNTPLDPSEPPPPVFPPDSSQPPELPPTSPQPTRNDLADEELNTILHSLSSPPPTAPPPKYRTDLTTPIPPEPSSTSPTHSTAITPRTIYPATISCRAAFDSAFYCQSLGGQFNSLYRYGGMRSCSEHWGSFWFCMRTNRGFMGDEEKQKRVREHYWRKEEKYRQGPSSEDVWALRGRWLGGWRGGRFEGDLEAVEGRERERVEEMRRLGVVEEPERGRGRGGGR